MNVCHQNFFPDTWIAVSVNLLSNFCQKRGIYHYMSEDDEKENLSKNNYLDKISLDT